MDKSSRRQFLKVSAAAAGSALAARTAKATPTPPPARSSAAQASRSGAGLQIAIAPPLSQLEYSQVELLDSVFRRQFDHNHKLFLDLNEDALLKPFREREGLPAPGPDMGGWYDNSLSAIWRISVSTS